MVPCSVVELRQYTLHPGRGDELVALFEREFVEPQEAAGIRVLGQFEDMEAPDHFVWFRGFSDMHGAADGTHDLLSGPGLAAHREAANATMVDSDDVLLLRPVRPAGGFPRRSVRSSGDPGASRALLRILHRPPGPTTSSTSALEQVRPVLEATGAAPVAWLETKRAANDYPRLPVRADADVLVCAVDVARRGRAPPTPRDAAADPAWNEEMVPSLGAG